MRASGSEIVRALIADGAERVAYRDVRKEHRDYDYAEVVWAGGHVLADLGQEGEEWVRDWRGDVGFAAQALWRLSHPRL